MSNEIINSIEHLQEQNSIDFQEIKRLDKEIKRLEETMHLHLRTYDGKLVADNSTGTALKEKVTANTNAIIELNVKTDNLDDDVKKLKEQVDNLDSNPSVDLTDINRKISNIQKTVSVIDNQVDGLLIDTSELQGQIDNLDIPDLSEVNSRLSGIDSNITNLQTDISELEGKIINPPTVDLTEVNTKIAELEATDSDLQSEIEILKNSGDSTAFNYEAQTAGLIVGKFYDSSTISIKDLYRRFVTFNFSQTSGDYEYAVYPNSTARNYIKFDGVVKIKLKGSDTESVYPLPFYDSKLGNHIIYSDGSQVIYKNTGVDFTDTVEKVKYVFVEFYYTEV